jgi:hypothetical protein
MDDRGDAIDRNESKELVIGKKTKSTTTASSFDFNNNAKSITPPSGSCSSHHHNSNNTLPTTNLASKACQLNFRDVSKINIRQVRRGCCQEIISCEARNEFKLFRQNNSNASSNIQFAYGIERANCFCRTCYSYVFF